MPKTQRNSQPTSRQRATNSKPCTTTKAAARGQQPETVNWQEKAQIIIGAILLGLTIFTAVSFASYISTGAADDKLIHGNCVTDIQAHNMMGILGAKWACWWINGCLGFGAFGLPILMLVSALRVLPIALKLRWWKWLVHLELLTLWTSIACDLCFRTAFSTSHISPGGKLGTAIVDALDTHTGTPFVAWMLVLISMLTYLLIVSSHTIKVIRMLLNPVDTMHDLKHRYPLLAQIVTLCKRSRLKSQGKEPAEMPQTAGAEPASSVQADATDIVADDIPDAIVATEDSGESTDDTSWINVATEPDITAHDDNTPADAGTPDTPFEIDPIHEEPQADPKGVAALEPYDPKLDLENYRYPTLDLLKHYDIDANAAIDYEEQTKNKDQIVGVLRNFGVEIASIRATVGPTITLYEITPAPGVRISKIRNLEDDIALSLAALGIRIIAPIPGKGTIGIEVPNTKPQIVSMESILNNKKFQETTMELPMALGKTITNEVYMADLTKMPHLLVAGATGQGKSVGLNAIITSLLYKKHPAELKLVMVDPKKVEFSIYSPIINHFLAQIEDDDDEPIITDVQKVINTLKSLCVEMDTRYDLLKRARARNIKEYNEKFRNRQLNPEHGHHFMPYIVVIIDEFGDLIMTAGKEIELPIARIAQLARAVGIHMIIATQRPTTNIITGTIKANFPARMAFKVSAMVDSRTILDRPGANQLVGKGDMLFLAGNEPIRVQCAFVDTPEVERICSFIATQQGYLRPFALPRPPIDDAGMSDGAADVDVKHLDPMFAEAARLIVTSQQGSTSLIQRKFAIGYNRAGRLMDQLERMGVVGPQQGSKPRDVLIQDETSLEALLNNIG